MDTAVMEPKGETEARILAAAKDVFAEVGFEGARVDEIARRAGVNKASLYYHIGDKHALYACILHDVVGSLAGRLDDAFTGLQDPQAKLRAYFATLAATIEANPQMPRIMLRELAGGGRNLPPGFFEDITRVITVLSAVMQEGSASGVFVPAVPVLVHLMTITSFFMCRISAPIFLQHAGLRALISEHLPAGLDLGAPEGIMSEIERLMLRAIMKEKPEITRSQI